MMQQGEIFARQIEGVQQALRGLQQRASGSPEPQAVAVEAMELISSSLEELSAIAENLRQAWDEMERTAELSNANAALRYQADLLAHVNDSA